MPSHKTDGVLTFLLRQTWLSMRAVVEDELVEFGLTVPQFATLLMLEDHPDFTVAEVARHVGSTRQSANEMIAGLEAEGLVSRSPHPTDGRKQTLTLTGRGREKVELALPAVTAREEALEAALPPGQREAVRAWMLGIAAACQEA
jgi:DNA-binding MarR family transcriptional regulator